MIVVKPLPVFSVFIWHPVNAPDHTSLTLSGNVNDVNPLPLNAAFIVSTLVPKSICVNLVAPVNDPLSIVLTWLPITSFSKSGWYANSDAGNVSILA